MVRPGEDPLALWIPIKKRAACVSHRPSSLFPSHQADGCFFKRTCIWALLAKHL